VAHHAVGKRIAPRDLPMALYMEGRRVPDGKTVAEAGIAPLSYVFVDYVE
jgi:Toluene-4-monooxygenase system protein B (TmoB)